MVVLRSSGGLMALVLALVLAGCGAATTATHGAPVTAGNLPAPRSYRNGTAVTRAVSASVGQLAGRDAQALTRLFGPPRLDVHDDAAHRLQFASDACVLDAYLYAPRDGADPVVTHVDTRAVDGSDVGQAACIAALQTR